MPSWSVSALIFVLETVVAAVIAGIIAPELRELWRERNSFLLWSAWISPWTTRDGLTEVRLAIWNPSRKPIRASEMASSDPLRIVAQPSVRLSSMKILGCMPGADTIALEPQSESEVLVKFEFINGRSGFVAAAIHSGATNSEIAVKGSIYGLSIQIRRFDVDSVVPIIPGRNVQTYVSRRLRMNDILNWILLVQSVMLIPFLASSGFITSSWMLVPAALAAILLFAMQALRLRRHLRLPRGLEKFYALELTPSIRR